MATKPSRRHTVAAKPTMAVSPKPKVPPPLDLSPKPDSPLKPGPPPPMSPKPVLSPKPKLPKKPVSPKPVISPPSSPSPGPSPDTPPEKPPKPLSPSQSPRNDKLASSGGDLSPTPGVTLRSKVSRKDPERREKLRRRYSLAVMSNVGVADNAISSSHDLRKEIERKGEEIWKTYCHNPPGYPTLFPPVPQLPDQLRDKLSGDNEDKMLRYRGESVVHAALANLPENLVVLQGFEFTHQEFGLYMSQSPDSNKSDKDIEGGCDFVAISDNHVVIFDVRSLDLEGEGAGDLFLKNFEESIQLRAKVSKLALRIIIKTFRFKMPAVRQFTVFPHVCRSVCEKMPQFTALSDSEKSSLLFSNDLENFSTWWSNQSKADKGKKDKEFHSAIQRVKQTLIGIWSMDRDNVSDTDSCGLGKNLTSIDTLMKGQKTVEIDDLISAVDNLSNKGNSPKMNGDDGSERLHGVKPLVHSITRRLGHDTAPLTTLLKDILDTQVSDLAEIDPTRTAVVCLNGSTSSSPLLENVLSEHPDSKSAVKSYEDVVAADWTAVTCFLDLSEVLRLSAMRDGSCQDMDAMILKLRAVLARVTTYFSLVLILGATEVQGDDNFSEFGNETINKTNRAYFQKTKGSLSALIQALVSRSCVKFYDMATSTGKTMCVPLPWSDIRKKLDSLFVFPDKKINRERVIAVTEQVTTLENHVLSIASKVNTQKSATKNWADKLGSGCRNDELKRVKNTIDKLQVGISEMLELQGKLATQLGDLSKLYQEVNEDVEANLD